MLLFFCVIFLSQLCWLNWVLGRDICVHLFLLLIFKFHFIVLAEWVEYILSFVSIDLYLSHSAHLSTFSASSTLTSQLLLIQRGVSFSFYILIFLSSQLCPLKIFSKAAVKCFKKIVSPFWILGYSLDG